MFPFMRFLVKGGSMEPNFKEGDYLIVNKWSRNFRRGDVVVALSAKEARLVLKRISRIRGGKYFLKGDSSGNYGAVNKESIIGKMIFKI